MNHYVVDNWQILIKEVKKPFHIPFSKVLNKTYKAGTVKRLISVSWLLISFTKRNPSITSHFKWEYLEISSISPLPNMQLNKAKTRSSSFCSGRLSRQQVLGSRVSPHESKPSQTLLDFLPTAPHLVFSFLVEPQIQPQGWNVFRPRNLPLESSAAQ